MNHVELQPSDFTLGTSARVQLSQAARAGEPLPRWKKTSLRTQAVKELIRSKPSGYRFAMSDFQRVTGQSYGAVNSFLKKLKQDGEIVVTYGDMPRKFRKAYAIRDDAVIKGRPRIGAYPHPTETPQEREDIATAEEEIKKEVPDTSATELAAPLILMSWQSAIVTKAKDFAWQFPEDGNDLRKFIAWYVSQE